MRGIVSELISLIFCLPPWLNELTKSHNACTAELSSQLELHPTQLVHQVLTFLVTGGFYGHVPWTESDPAWTRRTLRLHLRELHIITSLALNLHLDENELINYSGIEQYWWWTVVKCCYSQSQVMERIKGQRQCIIGCTCMDLGKETPA